MGVDPSGLVDAMALVSKRYGQSSLSFANNSPSVKRISTGSHELDYATSGGVPMGRFTRLYGPYSSGKSLCAWKIIANAQAMGQTCAYYNAEKQFDPVFVERIGVDISKLILVEGTIIEDIAVKMEELLGSVHVHAIDSLSSCVSTHELDSKMGDRQIGISAQAWGKALRRLLEAFDDHENTAILIDQVRDTFGVPGAAPHPPGGRMIEHTSSLSLSFRRGGWLYRQPDGYLALEGQSKSLSGQSDADGIETKVRVEKSRVCRPLRSANIRIDFKDMEYDTGFELAAAAKFYNVAKLSGSWFEFPDGTRVQGSKKLRSVILERPDLQEIIINELRSNW